MFRHLSLEAAAAAGRAGAAIAAAERCRDDAVRAAEARRAPCGARASTGQAVFSFYNWVARSTGCTNVN